MKLDYTINPILMGGLVKSVDAGTVKVHLHGRLGVIEIPREYILEKDTDIEIGHDMQFYFSYIQVNEKPYDYDDTPIKEKNFEPCFIGGTIIQGKYDGWTWNSRSTEALGLYGCAAG